MSTKRVSQISIGGHIRDFIESLATAGGITATTLAILIPTAFAEARGSQEMEGFDRRIPQHILRLSLSVTLWGALVQ